MAGRTLFVGRLTIERLGLRRGDEIEFTPVAGQGPKLLRGERRAS